MDSNAATAPPLLALNELSRTYALPRERLFGPAPRVQALAGVSLSMQSGRNLGVVGESGSGKSTLARLAMALEPPSGGSVNFMGRDLNRLGAAELRQARRDFQMVFQDPYGSLDPRQRVGRIVAEPLYSGPASERRERTTEALEAVGLRAGDADKYPHEFSGGQRQRIAIARALVSRPKLIVADEPVSALDVSVQAQVLNLMQDLQQQFGLTYLLISHDLAVVDHVCAEVAVMYAGRIVEQGTPEVLFKASAHPYTRALMAAVPRFEGGSAGPARRRRDAAAVLTQVAVSYKVATDMNQAPKSACSFAPRCPHRQARCDSERPALSAVGEAAGGHRAACHFAESLMSES